MKDAIIILKKLSLIVLIGVVGCVEPQIEESQVVQEEWLGEIRSVLKGELFEPAGKLQIRFSYQNEHESSLQGSRRYYYNSQGQEVLSLGFSAKNDTTVAWLPRHNHKGELVEFSVFRYPDWQNISNLNGGGLANLEWSSTSYYTYDEEGRLTSSEISNRRRERQPYMVPHYDEQGNVIGKEFFNNHEPIDWHVFEYDTNKRIFKETWRFPISAPHYRIYFYRYDERGLLVAKETGQLYNPDLEGRDAFQYFYDDQKRLVEEREFYPNMGFPILRRDTYKYFGGTEGIKSID